MAVKRKTYRYKGGTVIDIEEFHDGRYGAPGKQRTKRAKPTEEQMRKVNAINKAKRCRMRLLEYFASLHGHMKQGTDRQQCRMP